MEINKCPNCGEYGFNVKETHDNVNFVFRRKKCIFCGTKIKTYEISERDFKMLDMKKEKRLEELDFYGK